MEIGLKIGERGKLKEFTSVYRSELLKKHGYHSYELHGLGGTKVACRSLKTKYGELVVKDSDVVTYVGNNIWSVSRNENN